MSKSKMEILTELPKWESGRLKGRINWRQTVGMTIEVEHEDYGRVGFKVLNYKSSYLTLGCDGYVLEGCIKTDHFFNGNVGGILGVTKSTNNEFYLDKNKILHIYDKSKTWEALYTGRYIKKVMNTSWYISKGSVQTGSFNFQGNSKKLHHVNEMPKAGMVIDHIANPYNLIDKFYDCRKENLREVTRAENSKNRKCTNEWGYTGMVKYNTSWYSRFSYNYNRIVTKTKQDYNEALIDNLIAQRYLGYKHQEEEFYKLNELSEERIKVVTDLLDIKMKKIDDKIHEIKEYKYDIDQNDNYYILKKNGHEMLFDCDLDYIGDKYICYTNGYWFTMYLYGNKKIQNLFHRYILDFKPNEYKEYSIHIDHLNNNTNDNRFENLAITTVYGNQCNKSGVGYLQAKAGSFIVTYMQKYKFWKLIGGVKTPSFKTEQEAIQEVERRKSIIENGLADLDLGYLYWKGILEVNKVA